MTLSCGACIGIPTITSESQPTQTNIHYSGFYEDLTVIDPIEFQPGGGNMNSHIRFTGDWTNNSIIRINGQGKFCEIVDSLTLAGDGILEFPLGGGTSGLLRGRDGYEFVNELGHTIRSLDNTISMEYIDGEIYEFPAIGGPYLYFHNKGLIECAIAGGETEGGRLMIKVMSGSRNEGVIRNNGGQLGIGALGGYFINTGGVIENLAGHTYATKVAGGIILNNDPNPVVLYDVIGSMLEGTSDAAFAAFGGLVDSLTVNAPLELSVAWNHLTFRGNWINNSQITVSGELESLRSMTVFGHVSFNGSGSLIFTTENPLYSALSSNGDSLTNGQGHTLGGTCQLGGGPLRIYNEGILSPGAPVGTLPVAARLFFANTAELHIDLGGTIPGLNYDLLKYDQVYINESLLLDGVLNVGFTNGFETGILPEHTFMIIEPSNASATYSGSFTNRLINDRILTADELGSFLVTMDGSSVVLSDFQSAPSNPTPEESWAWQYFGDLNPATEATVWGKEANPDGDQFTNVLEYAFVLDPTIPNQSINPTEVFRDSAGFRMSLRQRKASSTSNLNYKVELSSTLQTGSWSSSGVSEIPPRESINTDAEWVTYQLPDAGDSPIFVRVNVTQISP